MEVYQRLLGLQRLLLPATCILCAGPGDGGDLCAGCRADLPVNSNACTRCAEQLTGVVSQPICGACLRRPPRYRSAHCAFRYGYPVDHLIRALKYHDRIAYARVLGMLLAQSLQSAGRTAWPELMIPTPLSSRRYAERGFNQAIEIAKYLRVSLHVPLRTDLLERIRDTNEQAGLDRDQRRRNVRGAFAVVRSLAGKHVAIVDDVITTGSTASEIARTLKRAGATHIEVWAVARAAR